VQSSKVTNFFTFVLARNQTCAVKGTNGEEITPPGLPLLVEEDEKFITRDNILIEL
jgi:hypothetical protein